MTSRRPESALLGWEAYNHRLRESALLRDYPPESTKKVISYAENLARQELPVIFDLEHFSLLVGYEASFLAAMVSATGRFYRQFHIPKRGDPLCKRCISEPLPSLKEIQRWLLDNVLSKMPASRYAKAYLPKIGIKHGARIHRGQSIVIRIDVEDFFGSIRANRIYWIFRSRGYTPRMASLFTNLCTLKGTLPQGAPTSAYLSNLALLRADARIAGFALGQGLRYTRYADDLTLSGSDFDIGQILSMVSMVLAAEGLRINESKTRIMRAETRQMCTGLIVNRIVNVPRATRRQFAQEVFYIRKFGILSHLEKMNIDERLASVHVDRLIGIGSFIYSINTRLVKVKDSVAFLQKVRRELQPAAISELELQ